MKMKQIIGIILTALIMLAAGSCSKGELNGDLEGNWQIMQVTDAEGHDLAIIPQRYISIMRNVVQLRIYGDRITTGALEYAEPYMTISFPYEEEYIEHPLSEWFIESNPVTFKVLKLDKKSLVLQEEGLTITCRRF